MGRAHLLVKSRSKNAKKLKIVSLRIHCVIQPLVSVSLKNSSIIIKILLT